MYLLLRGQQSNTHQLSRVFDLSTLNIYVYISLKYICTYSCVVSNLVPTSNHVCSISVPPIADKAAQHL